MHVKKIIQRVLPLSVIKKYHIFRDRTPRIVYNIGFSSGQQRRVLVTYVNDFVFKGDISNLHGTSNEDCAALISALVKKDCRVDLARYDCKDGIRSDYDFIIGQGDAFRLASAMNPTAKRVLFLTENPPSISFAKEKERIQYFEERHNIKLDITRSGKFFQECDFHNLHACIFTGNPNASDRLPGINTYPIRCNGIVNPFFRLEDRSFETARSTFIWIGSSGAVHKGLDILLDVFARHPELELRILGLNESDRRILQSLMNSNVRNYGYIPSIKSEEFAQIVAGCGFVVLPSCSEGLATSVITGMNHGLIPLVTAETNIISPTGEVFSDFNVETVEETIVRWSKMDVNFLTEQSILTRDFAFATYSFEQYAARMNEIIEAIIK